MISKELRKEFLDFFKKRGHKIIPSSSLIPKDPSVLLTTAGVQQFTPYYLGEKSPYGPNTTSCQKSFRTSDIEEVGDKRHLTFFEMLGNFSFGGYFKEEAIKLAYEFLTINCKFNPDRLWITYFKGDKGASEDLDSKKIWLKLKIPEDRIFSFSREDNFWGPTGLEGPCGPTTEIHYDLTGKPCKEGSDCIPNCDCERFIELWNLVFNEYYKDRAGKLTPLKQKGVDTGMGLERLAQVSQKKKSVFETDLFFSIIEEISKKFPKFYPLNSPPYRIIADHIKGSVFLISEGILPSNVERGYVLRRLIRRAIRYGKLLKQPENFLIPLAQKVIEIYQDIYPEVKSKEADILTALQNEEEKFQKTLKAGLKELRSIISWWNNVCKAKEIEPTKGVVITSPGFKEEKELGKKLFFIYQSYGFPLELSLEEFENFFKQEIIFKDEVARSFQEEFQKHQEISRAGAGKKFGGIGKKAGLEATKLHTATHLLHQALREVLGSHVKQMGSDITSRRLRFDFSHTQRMTAEEIQKVENLVNQKIKENLEVKKEEAPSEKALKSGALSFFKEKYPEKVTVYSINNFSKEICAGPHVKRTSELGAFKIIKEESSGAGVRRIRAILE